MGGVTFTLTLAKLPLASLIFGTLGVMRAIGGLIWGPLSDWIGRAACVVVNCGYNGMRPHHCPLRDFANAYSRPERSVKRRIADERRRRHEDRQIQC